MLSEHKASVIGISGQSKSYSKVANLKSFDTSARNVDRQFTIVSDRCKLTILRFSLPNAAVGLFPYENSVEQMAFELAIHKVNLDPTLSDRVKLVGRVEIVDVNDSYRTSQKGDSYSGIKILCCFSLAA